MTLRLTPELRAAVIAHCRAEHPIEACGILAGRADHPTRHVPLVNVLADQHRFAVDPDQQLAVYAELDAAGEDPVVLYHSHTTCPAVPSGMDRAAATDPHAHYLIVDTRLPDAVLRSWQITPDGVFIEEGITCG